MQDEDDTYLIYTAENLKEFAVIVNGTGSTPADNNANAKLMNDIDLNPDMKISEDGTVTGAHDQWTPIGTSITPYRGTFDGANHTISGLYIAGSNNYQGLFGYVNGGTVQNLSVSGTVSGGMHVGGVVGQNNGSVEDCAFSGSVKGSGNNVGGVVGMNNAGSSVKNCYNTGAVNGSSNFVGGVVGMNTVSGTVKNCYNIGEVSGSNFVGGVVGHNVGGVENCYNTGSVTGSSVGGVVGHNVGGDPDAGTVGGTVTGCYFLKQDGVPANGIGGGEIAGQTANSVTTLGELCEKFTEDEGWTTSPFYDHPVLTTNPEGGDGTAAHPYEIKTAAQLENFRDLVNGEGRTADTDAHAKLMNNIDLNPEFTFDAEGNYSGPAGEEPQEWTPIGNSSNKYTDTFDGQNHRITGLYVDAQSDSDDVYLCLGLFGFVDGSGLIKNLAVAGSVSGSVTGNNSTCAVGGVVGYNNSGSIENCTNEATIYASNTVAGSNAFAGGVVGQNFDMILNCTNTGKVTGIGYRSGGVAGANAARLERCINNGEVTGSDYVGGVAASNDSSGTLNGVVENCINTGSVKNTQNGGVTGGVVGANLSQSDIIAANCYSIGTVSGSAWIDGVVGFDFNYRTIKNCYYLSNDTSGDEDESAKSSEEFASGEVAYLLQGEQTEQVWGQTLGSNDYPQLCALNPDAAQKVYRLTFDWGYDGAPEDVTTTTYTYTNGSVILPEIDHGRDGYSISGWNGYTEDMTVSEDTTFTAQWTENPVTYTVTVSAGEGGDVETSATSAEAGTDITVTATPAQGYTFVRWTEDGAEVSTDAVYTFNLNADRNLVAVFAKQSVDPEPEEPSEPDTPSTPSEPEDEAPVIDVTEPEHGTVAISPSQPEAGDTVTITPQPEDGYEVEDVIVTDEDGNRVEVTENADGSWTYTQPESDVTIEVIFGEIEPEPTTDVSDIFVDVAPDAWYTAAIQYAYDNSLMTGVSADAFAPEATTTRAMIVSILARLENVTSAEAAGFNDVNDEWYATAVNWAANVGVVNGYEDNTFKPNTAITREQLAAILMNYASYKGQDVSARAALDNYTDQPSTWATETMQWAVAEGLISGVTKTELQPQGNATRAQVAAILERFLAQ